MRRAFLNQLFVWLRHSKRWARGNGGPLICNPRCVDRTLLAALGVARVVVRAQITAERVSALARFEASGADYSKVINVKRTV